MSRVSGEEHSDPAGRNLLKRHSLTRLAASPLDFALAATLRAPVLQHERAPRSAKRLYRAFVSLVQEKEGLQKLNLVPQEKSLLG